MIVRVFVTHGYIIHGIPSVWSLLALCLETGSSNLRICGSNNGWANGLCNIKIKKTQLTHAKGGGEHWDYKVDNKRLILGVITVMGGRQTVIRCKVLLAIVQEGSRHHSHWRSVMARSGTQPIAEPSCQLQNKYCTTEHLLHSWQETGELSLAAFLIFNYMPGDYTRTSIFMRCLGDELLKAGLLLSRLKQAQMLLILSEKKTSLVWGSVLTFL